MVGRGGVEKLRHGIFMEIRPHSMPGDHPRSAPARSRRLVANCLVTDDRSASDTLRMGATDYNVRLAIQSGLSPEIAIRA